MIMIQYRKFDGTLGEFDSDKFSHIRVDGNTFTIIIRHCFNNEWDRKYEEIKDVTEIRFLEN